MTIAILGTIFLHEGEVSGTIYGLIFGAIALGTVIGWMTAKKVQMTKMPELVSMFNGMGGACAALISLIEFNHYYHVEFPKVVLGASINRKLSSSLWVFNCRVCWVGNWQHFLFRFYYCFLKA